MGGGGVPRFYKKYINVPNFSIIQSQKNGTYRRITAFDHIQIRKIFTKTEKT
jgi:hypothetical protein